MSLDGVRLKTTNHYLYSLCEMWRLQSSRLPRILRPRLTLRYIFCSASAVYLAYCSLLGMPALSSKLPQYTGPYSVGVIDVESPCDGRTTCDIEFKDSGEPAFKVSAMSCRILSRATKDIALFTLGQVLMTPSSTRYCFLSTTHR